MTRDETKQILMILETSYANFHVENKTQTVDVWHMLLKDFTYKDIQLALVTYIQTSGSAFAPSVAELIAMTRKPVELAQMDEVTAWTQVRKAIKRGLYYSEEEFNKLSPEVQKAVGAPAQIREWAQLPSDEIETVIQSNFRRRFDTMQKRDLEIQALPTEVRQAIEKKMDNLIVCT